MKFMIYALESCHAYTEKCGQLSIASDSKAHYKISSRPSERTGHSTTPQPQNSLQDSRKFWNRWTRSYHYCLDGCRRQNMVSAKSKRSEPRPHRTRTTTVLRKTARAQPTST